MGYDDIEMTDEQKLALEGFVDLMVGFFMKYSNKVDYSVLEQNKDDAASAGDQ